MKGGHLACVSSAGSWTEGQEPALWALGLTCVAEAKECVAPLPDAWGGKVENRFGKTNIVLSQRLQGMNPSCPVVSYSSSGYPYCCFLI